MAYGLGENPGTSPSAKPAPSGGKGKSHAERKARKDPGIPRNARIRLDGKWATPEDIDTINTILDAAESKDVATILGKRMKKAILALVCANIGESNYDKFVRGGYGNDYWGIYQLSPSWRSKINYLNLDKLTKMFLVDGGFAAAGDANKVINAHPDWTPGMIAGAVEGSDKQGAAAEAYYGKFENLARDIIEAYGGIYTNGVGDTSNGEHRVAVPFKFSRPYPITANPYQDSWACINALADEVGWSLFAMSNRVYYFSEPRLAAQTPIIISRTDPDLAPYLGEWSLNRNNDVDASSGTINIMCDPMWFHAGECVLLDGFGGGKNDRWLITDTRRSVFAEYTELTLAKPKYPQPEPAHDWRVAKNGGDTPAGWHAPVEGAPKHIIDTIVIPMAKSHGMVTGVDVSAVEAANAAHPRLTSSGNVSEHKGPPDVAWAVDMSNGTSPTPEMDDLAKDIAKRFGIPWHGSGLVNHVSGDGYRFQLIYRYDGHYNHVHLGVRVWAQSPSTPTPSQPHGGPAQ